MKVSEQNRVDVRDALGRAMLAGVQAGQQALTPLHGAAASATDPLVLDFANVELVTASAFREAFLPVVEWAAADGRPCFLANINEITREEASIAAAQTGKVLLFATLYNDVLDDVKAVGQLEEKLALTLHIVLHLKVADAKAVKEHSGESTVTTAWNNRLVALSKMGLLCERKVGKTKFYSPVASEMTHGR